MSKPGFSKKNQLFCQGILWGGLGFLLFWPAIAFSQILQIPLTLSRQANEEFDVFVQRATALSATTLKKRFETDKTLNQVRIVVIGENNGQVTPVLQVTMSRQQWLSDKNPEPYISYFPDSKKLLDFQAPQPSPSPDAANSGTASPAPAPSPNDNLSPSPQPSPLLNAPLPTAPFPNTPGNAPNSVPPS